MTSQRKFRICYAALIVSAIVCFSNVYYFKNHYQKNSNQIELSKEIKQDEVTLKDSVQYPVKLIRVIDGDTYELEIYIWEDIKINKKIRLLGVNTPELHPKKGTEKQKEEERIQANNAKDYVISILKNKNLYFVYSWKSDNFGRPLGRVVWYENENLIDMGTLLLENKYAKIYIKK